MSTSVIERVVCAYAGFVYKRVYRRLHPRDPFFTPKAIKALDAHLSPEMQVFEWGSGMSTLWFAERVRRVVSVEHDSKWYRRTAEEITKRDLRNVTLIYAPPNEDGKRFLWESNWPFYAQLGHPPRKKEFKDYMSAIDAYSDGCFDCICIDGRERVGCLMHAVPKLRDDGFIILDDSSRERYGELFDFAKTWRTERYPFGIKETSFLRPLQGR